MNLNRLFTSLLLMVMSMVCVNATEADDIKKKLEHAQGKEKLEYLCRLCDLSLEGDDYELQWKCIDDYLKEAHRQSNRVEESDALWMRSILFYNNDQNDSIYKYIEDDLRFIREYGTEEKYYDA